MSTDDLLRIPKPTTTKLHRQSPGRATMGDSAEVRLEPGILDLLTSPIADSVMPLGAGILPETIIGLSVSATAAYLALGDQERTYRPANWGGGEMELTWTRPARSDEALVGRARLREMRRFTLHVDVETSSAKTGEVLMTGEIRFVAIRNGHAVRLTDRLLAFEQPALEAARDRYVTQSAKRIARATPFIGAVLRRAARGPA